MLYYTHIEPADAIPALCKCVCVCVRVWEKVRFFVGGLLLGGKRRDNGLALLKSKERRDLVHTKLSEIYTNHARTYAHMRTKTHTNTNTQRPLGKSEVMNSLSKRIRRSRIITAYPSNIQPTRYPPNLSTHTQTHAHMQSLSVNTHAHSLQNANVVDALASQVSQTHTNTHRRFFTAKVSQCVHMFYMCCVCFICALVLCSIRCGALWWGACVCVFCVHGICQKGLKDESEHARARERERRREWTRACAKLIARLSGWCADIRPVQQRPKRRLTAKGDGMLVEHEVELEGSVWWWNCQRFTCVVVVVAVKRGCCMCILGWWELDFWRACGVWYWERNGRWCIVLRVVCCLDSICHIGGIRYRVQYFR